MSRRSGTLRWLLLFVVLLLGAWYWQAPHRAYHQFVRALAFGSEPALAETVDFPQLREHLKSDIGAAIERRSRSRAGGIITSALLDGAVDATLTPSGLSNLVTAFGTRPPGDAAADTLQAGTDVSFRYRGLSRVDVHVKPRDEPDARAGILTFSRQGTSWRLTRIWSEQLLDSGGTP